MTYSDLFDPAEGDDKAKAGINLRYGIEAQPDQAARDSDLAKRYGLPAGVIESYRPDYESRAKIEDVMPLLDESPKLRGWLAADPIRAKVSHDDIGNLSAIEGAIRYMVSAPDAPRGGLVADVFKAGRAIASGAPSASAGLYGAAAAPFEVLGLDTIGQALRGQQKNAQAVSDSVRGMSPDAGFLEQSLMSGFQSAGQNLITLPFGLAAKTPNLMLGIMGAITGGQSYGKGRDAGLDPAQAAAFGIQDATAEIVTERFLGAAGFLKNIKAGASAGKLFGYEVFKEVPGEIGATLWQNFNEWANVNPDKSVHDFLSEQPSAIAQTIIATLVGGSVQIGAVKGIEAAVGRAQAIDKQAHRAEFGAAQMDAIASIVQASKLNARSPATFDAMVQEMAAENVPAVFVSAQALMQSGVNLDELAKALPSVAAQLQAAAQTGGDIEIPTSEFVRAVPGSTFQQQMIDHARTSPDAMSRAEAQVFMAEKGDAIKAELDAEITRREEDSTWKMQRDEVAAQFERDMSEVGRFTPAVNKQYATLFGNFYATTAARAGMTAGELAQKYPLRFQATAAPGRVMEQGSQRFTEDNRLSNLNPNGGSWQRIRENNPTLAKLGPDDEVTVYRATVGDTIRPDDFVAVSKKTLAVELKNVKARDKSAKIIEQKVKVRDLLMGNDATEFVYFPESQALNQSAKLPDTIEIDGQQRSTTNSKGQPIAATEEGVRNFWEWFGSSRVVDANGRPLVVYHGTAADFDTFNPKKVGSNYGVDRRGFFFADDPDHADVAAFDARDAANRKSYDKTGRASPSAAPSLMPVYLRADEPLMVDAGRGEQAANFLDSNKSKLLARVTRSKSDALIVHGADGDVIRVVFDPSQIKSATGNTGAFDPANPSILNQGDSPRAQIAFGANITQTPSIITIFDGADLSSTLHEAGHFFLEVQADLASRIAGQIRDGATVSDGEREILRDMNALLNWFGERDSPEVSALDQWLAKSIDERRAQHEHFAESWEQYLMEGKAPSLELQPMFSKFRSWLVGVYKSVKQFLARRGVGDGSFNYVVFSGDDVAIKQTFYQGGERQISDIRLTDEVRQVMDRMIATADQIQEAETVRAMGPLFAEQGGMSPDQWAAYQQTGEKATQTAVDALQAKAMADMKWLSGARSKKLRELQAQAEALRRGVRAEVTREVMSQPVYRAWTFLTGKGADDEKAIGDAKKRASKQVDPEVDSLFVAIAKHGGIRKDEAIQQWGIDPKEQLQSGVFGRPVLHASGGRSIDSMVELLAEDGYLLPDQDGMFYPAMLENIFDQERRGTPVYSIRRDYSQQDEAPVQPLADHLTHGKLNTDDLKAMYGSKPDALWRKLSDRRMTSGTGIQPDVLAETFGFGSGDALARALADARPPRDVIRDLTDERMLQEHGELATPEGLDRSTTEALANAVRTRFLAQELQALEDAGTVREDAGPNKRGQRRTVDALDKAAEQYAAQTIGAMQIKDIKPHKFEAAAVRAAKLAAKAFKAGNTAEAAMHKRSELVQLHAAKAAHAALAEIDQAREFFGRINNRSIDKLGKTYDIDVVQAIRAVLGEYGLGTKGEKAAQYLNAVERNDPDMHRVLSAQLTALVADAVPFGEMSVDRLRALSDEIGAMWHLARRSKQMEIDGNLIDREEVQADLLARLEDIGVPATVPGEGRAVTEKERRISRIREAGAALMRVENWAIRKDGADNGVFTRFVFRPIKAASDAYRRDKSAALKQYRTLLEGIDLGAGRISAPELGYEFGHSRGGSGKAELMHAILHTGNESNKRKLLLGRGWAAELPDGTIDTGRWERFVERMIREGKLTKADFNFAQGVWDLLESLKPLAQKTHRDVFGRYFDEITADPVTNSLGTWAGGYVPAMTDAEVVKDAATRALSEAENSTMAFAFPATAKGFTKSRVEYNKPLLLDLRALGQHIDKVLLFSHLEQPVRDVRRILSSNDVAEPLHRIDPAAFGSLITPWLNRAARQQVETPIPGDGGTMRILSKLRTRAGMSAMMANIANTAQQITGFPIAAVKVGPRYLMSAAARYITSPRKTAESVAEASVYMASRMDNEVMQMSQDIDAILTNPSLYEQAQQWSAKHAYFMQGAVDNVMGPIIWTGAYNQALERGDSESDARAYADGVIRQTQGSTLPEDVSRIESGNAWWRMFAQFAGYFNMQANLLGTEFANQTHDMGLRNGAGKGLYIFTLGFLVPALLSELIVQAFRGGPDDDDKDGQWLDDWFAAFGMGTVRSAVAMVPVVGQVANYAINLANTKPYDDRISTAPAISMIESAVRAPQSVYKAMAGDGSSQKAVRDVATLISLTTGLPAAAIARPVGYVAGVAQDSINPTSAADAARGIFTGIASPESK